ncbi:MAG TPA: VTT domain-containing protein [Sphingomicrobium sp.]|nr:VTT domain-containing protein [Sphingomicrobium sp.]
MIEILPDWLPMLADNELLVAAVVFAVTTALIALWIPGVLLPIAASASALLNFWAATVIVTLGALVGSMIIFVVTRRLAHDRVPAKISEFVEACEKRFRARGAWLVLGLRLIGTPHFLVSAGSALMPVRASSFALATLAGMAPAILMAALAGSAI